MATAPIIFTLDLEDDQGAYVARSRFEANTHRLMDALAERQIRGTVFAVGRTADSSPELLRRLVALGHEVACHSWDHTPIDRQSPSQFRAATAMAKERLEQAAGAAVLGYRAPLFSLTPRTAWAAEELQGLGFKYSSSLLPVHNPVYGFPRALRRPFRWTSGLVEFPVPVVRLGTWGVPYLGGIYLRYLPLAAVRLFTQWSGAQTTNWTYIHPYDFDPEGRTLRKPGQPLWRYWLQQFNRGHTLQKLLGLLAAGQATSLGQLANDAGFVAGLAKGPLP